jgi:hypothetical protein
LKHFARQFKALSSGILKSKKVLESEIFSFAIFHFYVLRICLQSASTSSGQALCGSVWGDRADPRGLYILPSSSPDTQKHLKNPSLFEKHNNIFL